MCIFLLAVWRNNVLEDYGAGRKEEEEEGVVVVGRGGGGGGGNQGNSGCWIYVIGCSCEDL